MHLLCVFALFEQEFLTSAVGSENVLREMPAKARKHSEKEH